MQFSLHIYTLHVLFGPTVRLVHQQVLLKVILTRTPHLAASDPILKQHEGCGFLGKMSLALHLLAKGPSRR